MGQSNEQSKSTNDFKVIKTLESKVVYKNNWMSVHEDIIERESGAKGLYGVVRKPDFAVILPICHGYIYLVEQYRYPVKQRFSELPQGAWESNPEADHLLLAMGELQEETGLIAHQMTYIGAQYLAYGFCDQKYHIYLASEFSSGEQALDPEEEDLVCKRVKLADFEQMILAGEIMDATTVNAYGLAKIKGLI